MTLITMILGLACQKPDCPEGFLMNNDGLCIEVSDDSGIEGDTDTDTDADSDTDADADGDSDADTDSDTDTDTGVRIDEDGDGYTVEEGDCDDTDANYHPNAPEDDCTDPNDYNCDGSTGQDDEDGDGYVACDDCDDTNENANPGVEREDCDTIGIDDNCDGYVDELEDPTSGESMNGQVRVCHLDADGDGHGDPTSDEHLYCSHNIPTNYVWRDTNDCDDTDANINGDATEDCGNSLDENCDDKPDYQDSTCDGGGYGNLLIEDEGTWDAESPVGTADGGGVYVEGSGSCTAQCATAFVHQCSHQCTLSDGDIVVFPVDSQNIGAGKGGMAFARASCTSSGVSMQVGIRQTDVPSTSDLGEATSIGTSETALVTKWSVPSATDWEAEVIVQVTGSGTCDLDGANVQLD